MNLSLRTTLLALATTAALAGTLAVSSAQAATSTGSLAVKIVITESCTFGTSTDVDFSSQVRSVATANATGALSVNCSTGTPYTVTLGDGANFSGGSRRMANTGSTLFIPYSLSSVSAGGAAFTSVGGTGNGSAQSIPVYGRVTVPNVAAGSYSDTVVATITY